MRTSLALLTGLLCLAGCAMSGRRAPLRELRRAPYQVVYAKQPPTINGILDDAVWKKAETLEVFYQYHKTGVKLPDTARAMMAWDKANLYFAITINDKDIFVSMRERDAPISRADVAELFFKPPVKTRYETELYEFEFNVWEAILDIHFVGYGGGSSSSRFAQSYNPPIVCKATHKGTINDWSDIDEEYTLEVAIPLTAFSHAAPDGVAPGDRWKFNVAGYDYSVYRRRPLLFTSVDGNMKGFAEYELYPSMIFLGKNSSISGVR